MFSIYYPCRNYDRILDVLSTTKTNSEKTSSLPLADFWYPNRNDKQKNDFLKHIGIDNLITTKADYCFEYPTPAYENGKFGKTLPYSKPSMTDLTVFLEDKYRITIEAKYTEFVKDSQYKPLLKQWLDGKEHRQSIAQCWIDYIYKSKYGNIEKIEELTRCDFDLPYQFLHRVASACFNCEYPILVYQLFYDSDSTADYKKMKEFEELLKQCAKYLKLNQKKLPFYILEIEVTKCPDKCNKGESDQLFIEMKSEAQYNFGDDVVLLNGYTLESK